MKKNILLWFVMLSAAEASFFFSSCDKVEDPYNSTPVIDTGGIEVKVRKVLIEDFTGQKCGNCPGAATTIETIKSTHGEKVISIAVHANFYAVPGAAPYTYDFRTNEGDDYDAFFQPPAFPNGMVSRRGYPNNHWKNVGSWADTVNALLAVPPDAHIEITNSYSSASRVLNTSVKTEFLNSLLGNYKLVVLLTEDSIVKPQTDYSQTPSDVLNYVHRHALRDGITGSWGDVLNTASVYSGDTIVKAYQYTLPSYFPASNGIAPYENHCYVVAYIYDAATYEVIQVEEKKIK